MRCLIDSGVLLRLLKRDDPLFAVCRDTVVDLLRNGDELFTSVQNIAEFTNVWTRPASARGGFGFPTEHALKRIDFIQSYGTLLTESLRSYTEWRRLVEEHSISGVSVHDARIVSVMVTHRISHIVTLNASDFKRYEGILAIDPSSNQ